METRWSTGMHGPASRRALGQEPEEWRRRAKDAVARFDLLLARISLVADDEERGRLLKEIGRDDVPGTPAERYTVVKQDLAAAEAQTPEVATARIRHLEEDLFRLDTGVALAEDSYGTLAAPEGAAGAPGRTAAGLVAGGIALLGLVVVPLLAD
jgi:hypothetical protein